MAINDSTAIDPLNDTSADFQMIPGETATITRNGDGTWTIHSDFNGVTWSHVGDTFKVGRW